MVSPGIDTAVLPSENLEKLRKYQNLIQGNQVSINLRYFVILEVTPLALPNEILS